MPRDSCACRASRRQDWRHRGARTGYFHWDTRELIFDEAFLQAFSSEHSALKGFVDGLRQLLDPGQDVQARLLGWRRLKIAWGEYYSVVGDGPEACGHFTRACEAAGARISSTGRTAPNCALLALGPYIGAPQLPSSAGDFDDRVPATLNRALCGFIRRRPADGRNECIMTPWYDELLHDLGFTRADHPPKPMDLVVYTVVKPTTDERGTESAVHFGRVVVDNGHDKMGHQTGRALMVESKSGYAFHTYVHPVNVVDPTYLIEAPCMRVHFYRQHAPPLPSHELTKLAGRYEERMRSDFGYGV